MASIEGHMEGYETWENKKEDLIITTTIFVPFIRVIIESTIPLYRKCLPTNAVLSSSWRWQAENSHSKPIALGNQYFPLVFMHFTDPAFLLTISLLGNEN